MQTIQTRCTEGALWDRIFQPMGEALSVAAARNILQLEFPPEDKERMQELAAKARDGALSAAEQEVIRNYERVGNLLGIIKAKARQRLKGAARSNGSDG
jgi:hypothetical protein